jgi:hypothetical protein
MPSDVAATTHANKKLPKVLESIEMRKGKSGGHSLTHRYTHMEHAPETHIFGAEEGSKLMQHLSKHMGIKLDSEAAAGTEENEGAKEKAQL